MPGSFTGRPTYQPAHSRRNSLSPRHERGSKGGEEHAAGRRAFLPLKARIRNLSGVSPILKSEVSRARALARLKNAVGRVEASWRPASPDEGFRDRSAAGSFNRLSGDQFVAHDAVARGAFV